jgi:hypothetical protein
MTAPVKFGIGELLHNRNTNEDGLVTWVYQLLRSGEPSPGHSRYLGKGSVSF